MGIGMGIGEEKEIKKIKKKDRPHTNPGKG